MARQLPHERAQTRAGTHYRDACRGVHALDAGEGVEREHQVIRLDERGIGDAGADGPHRPSFAGGPDDDA